MEKKNDSKIKEGMQKPKKKGRAKLTEFELYGSFLALPTDDKDKVFGFHDDAGFSIKYKVSRPTLSEWKQDDRLWEIRDKYMKKFREYTPNVLKYLYKGMAEKNGAPEAMAWFKLVEKYTDKTEIKHGVNLEEVKKLTEATNKIIDSWSTG